MIKPFKGNYSLTQGFGNKFYLHGVDVYAQYGLQGHNGLDYGVPDSTQILAPHNGIVKEAFDEGSIGYGKYIKIENEQEGSVLAHLKEFKVEVGQEISQGQVIALSDNTGNSTGPHLHWGYYTHPRNRNNGYAGFIDQFNLISDDPMVTLPQKEVDKMRKLRDTRYTFIKSLTDFLQIPYNSNLDELLQKIKDVWGGHQSTKTNLENKNKELEQQVNVEKEKAKIAREQLSVKTGECQNRERSLLDQINELKNTSPDIKKIVEKYEGMLRVEMESNDRLVSKNENLRIELAKCKLDKPSLLNIILSALTKWVRG